MCCSIRKFYKCGHSEIITRECIRKDSGVKNWIGRRKACPKDLKIQYDDNFICGLCTATRLARLESDAQTRSVMVLLLRNEKYLKQRALARGTFVEPVLDLSTPTSAEIDSRCQANDEFLARRERRWKMTTEERYLECLDSGVGHLDANSVVGEVLCGEERSSFSSGSSASLEEDTVSFESAPAEIEQMEETEDVDEPHDPVEPEPTRASAPTISLPFRPMPRPPAAPLPLLPATTYTPTHHPLFSPPGLSHTTTLLTILSLPPTTRPHQILSLLTRNPSLITSITHCTIPLRPIPNPKHRIDPHRPSRVVVRKAAVALHEKFYDAYMSLDWRAYAMQRALRKLRAEREEAEMGTETERMEEVPVGGESECQDGKEAVTAALEPSRPAPRIARSFQPRSHQRGPSPLRQTTTLAPSPSLSPSSTTPSSLPVISHHTPTGTALLRTIRDTLNLSAYYSAQDVEAFIAANPEYVARICDGRIEVPLRGSQEEARGRFERALSGLDWGEVRGEAV